MSRGSPSIVIPLRPSRALSVVDATLRQDRRLLQSGKCSKRGAKPFRRHSKRPMTDISLLFEPPFARVVLNRPERHNAISRAMWRALPTIRGAIEARQDALVVLIEGPGEH